MDLLGLFRSLMIAKEGLDLGIEHGVKEACELVERTAKDAIGTYEFGWPPLSDGVVARHGDTPLLETGTLKESISHWVEGHQGWVGTTDPVAVFHELGTSRMPPRPIMGPALERSKQKAVDLIFDGGVGAFLHPEK